MLIFDFIFDILILLRERGNMNIWKINTATGRYPFLRIMWNMLWAIPAYMAGAVFIFSVLMQSGSIDHANHVKNSLFY
jgi:hypothetical protein